MQRREAPFFRFIAELRECFTQSLSRRSVARGAIPALYCAFGKIDLWWEIQLAERRIW